MLCVDIAKGLPGQSVTLSQFCVLSTPKLALMLTVTCSKEPNSQDDMLQHLQCPSHLSLAFKCGAQNGFAFT